MSDLRSVQIIGRLCWDAAEEFTRGGKKIARLMVACGGWRADGNGGGERYTDFFPITLFLRDGDKRLQYLKKGQFVEVSGRLRQSRWEKDGRRMSALFVSVGDINIVFDRRPAQCQPSVQDDAASDDECHIPIDALADEAIGEPYQEADGEYF